MSEYSKSAHDDGCTFISRLAQYANHLLTLVVVSTVLVFNSSEARAEGSWQLGLFEGLTHAQPITEGNISVGYTTLNADILTPGEVINLHICGVREWNNIRVIIRDPSGATVYSQTRNDSNIGCNDPFTSVWDPAVTDPFQYVTNTSGNHELRLYNLNSSQFSRVDITVTDNIADLINPQENQGRIWTTAWRINAGGFGEERSTDANLFVPVDGGFVGTYAMWELDLNNFAGFVYTLKGNDVGVTNSNPDTNSSGLSVPTGGGNTNTALYPIYLAYPAKDYPLTTQTVTAENFRFLDDEGQDAAISPSTTASVQDTGSFFFDANNTSKGVYEIVIDVGDGSGGGPDGVYGQGDVFLIGRLVTGGGANEVIWNGRDNAGDPVADGYFTTRLRVRVGEFHFVADDVETSGGPSDRGLIIKKAVSSTTTIPTIVYWDDFTVQNSTEPDAFNVAGIYDGEHSWGVFGGGGPGNNAFIDTYAYSQTSDPALISVGVSPNDLATQTIVKSFLPDAVVSGSPSTMKIDVTNNGVTAITNVSFTDSFPAGMTLAQDPSTLSVTGSGCAGFATDAATVFGGDQFNVSGGIVPFGSTCTLEIDVTATLTDLYNNVTSGVMSDQTAAGPPSNSASLRIIPGASGPALTCDATTYVSGGSTTRLYTVDQAASAYTLSEFSGTGYAPSSDYSHNGLGFNPVDNYLYSVVGETTPGSMKSGSVLRIDSDGMLVNLGIPVQGPQLALMPTSTTRYVGGAFAPSGIYYVVTDSDTSAPLAERSRILAIDVATSPPEIITNSSHGRDLADIAVHPDGTVYGYTSSNQLITIDPSTGSSAVVGAGSAGPGVDAMTFDATGQLKLTNSAGTLHTVDLATGATTQISTGTALAGADGASCPYRAVLEKRAVSAQAIAGSTIGYEFTIYNSSSAPISFDLTDSFTDGRTFVADTLVDPVGGNANEYGDTNTLSITGLLIPANGSETLSVEVRLPLVTPIAPLLNQASLGGSPPELGGVQLSDNPATNVYGDPTAVNVIGKAVIGVAKKATIDPADQLQVIFDFRLDNHGTVALTNFSLPDDLDTVFGAGNYSIITAPSFVVDEDPGSLELNANYTGNGANTDLFVPGNSSLSVGDSALIQMVVLVTNLTDQGYGLGSYRNHVTATATDPLGGSHSDLSDDGDLSDADGDGDPTESVVNGADSDENDETVFIVTDPNSTPIPDVKINKLVEDVNGGDLEPGDVLRYTLRVINSLTTPVVGLTVTDDMPSLLSNITLVTNPTGSTAVITPAPSGANGNGVLVVTGLQIAANSSSDIVFDAAVNVGAAVGTVVTNTATVDYPAGENDTDTVTTIVYEPFVAAMGTKPLYMQNATTLSRAPLASDPGITRVTRSNSRRWSLSPATTGTLTFDAGIVPVYIWMSGFRTIDFDTRVRLNSIGTTSGPISAELSQVVTILDRNVRQLVRYDLVLANDVTLAPGSQVQLEMFNDNPDRNLRIYPRNGTHSRVEPQISTVINVDSIDTLDAVYPGGNSRSNWFANDTLQIRAVVSDPFGAADISAANLRVLDESGANIFGPVSMGNPVASTAGTKTYETSYTLPATVNAGTWRVIVTAEEGTEGTVTHSAFNDINVSQYPTDFGDAPDLVLGIGPSEYRTRLVDDGARHQVVSELFLGTSVDTEIDGFVDGIDVSGDAGDDDAKNGDDEDGVIFTTLLRPGFGANATISATNGTGNTAYLNAWIDYNGDGDFAGVGEQIAADLVVASGNTSLDFIVPVDAIFGSSYARFRYSSQSGLGPNGLATSGEVEDHPVSVGVAGFTVSGRIFNDRDVSGDFSAYDLGVAGVAVVLHDNTLGTCIATETNGEGLYVFNLVLDGNYTVYESAYARIPIPDFCPPSSTDPAEHISVGSNNITFSVSGSDVGSLDFADAREPSLFGEHAASIEPGNAEVYPHNFVASADGVVAFNVSGTSTPLISGWNTVLYRDATCDARIGGDDTAIVSDIVVVADEDVCLLVKVNAATNATDNSRYISSLSATFTYADPSGIGHGLSSIHERTDVTTVTSRGVGRLVLDKFVENLSDGSARARSNAADTGDVLRYTVMYENAGVGGVSDLRVNDATPAFTSLAAAIVCPATLPPGISSCTIQIPALGANAAGYTGSIEWRFDGRLVGGSSGELSFDVMVE